ncbi:lysoplasmalogenase [Algoriphagus pacificus]|uniref:Lysoplasmalogenase n=1 Tax=Algoriphagus pacificus TaxID=2811234 RepID=A0ABS3CAJ2_9BACT|nr:lysoplasmalogenase [Algoriphagus pacificus]MBN7814132.1 lysoplasmalogenase [Algoriphagus pacificus]
MRNKNFAWLYLFLFATLVDLSFILEKKQELRYFSKPLIIIGLLIYFFQITKPIASTLLTKSILGALVFSWIGDVLLLWPNLFAYGLGAFLLAHICYIIGFKVAQKNPGEIGQINFIKSFLLSLPFFILAAFVYYLIQPNLGVLKIPVIIYVITIVSMVNTARERFGKCQNSSFWQVMIGATLFFISDGVLAIDRFYMEFPEAGILIMGTYAVGQLLIVMGIRSFVIQPK